MSLRRFEILHERAPLKEFLGRDPFLHIYGLGDLDPFYWPYTSWYVLRGPGGRVEALVLGYFASHAVFLAYASPGEEPALRELLTQLQPYFPTQFYAHASPGLSHLFETSYHCSHTSQHLKMALRNPKILQTFEAEGEALGPEDVEEVKAFYADAYPGNWFEERMLDSKQYFGIRREGKLAALAGVHVYAPTQNVAALGNVATHPDYRGQGLGTAVTAKLCRSLLEKVDTVGLNVVADNAVARACYEKLGFEVHAPYEEFRVKARLFSESGELD